MRLLEVSGVELDGKNAVVVGRSNIVGKPMALLLLQKKLHRHHCAFALEGFGCGHAQRGYTLWRSAVRGFITGDMIKPGAAVMDVGINRVDGKVVGTSILSPQRKLLPHHARARRRRRDDHHMLMENTVGRRENYARHA